MEKRMSVMGVGEKIAGVTVVYLIIMLGINWLTNPLFRITENNYNTLFWVGIMVGVAGFVINMVAAISMIKAYKRDTLATKGLYAIFPNPMYTFQLLITVPGLLLLFNSWLVLTTVVVAFISFKIFIKGEEEYLEKRYGDIYRAYRKKVMVKFL